MLSRAGFNRVRQALPLLAMVGGGFLLVIGALAGVMFVVNPPANLTNRSKAADTTTAQLGFVPTSGQLTPGTTAEKKFNVTMTFATGSQPVDGLQLHLLLKGDVTNLTVRPIAASGLSLVKNTTSSVPGGIEAKLLFLPLTAGQPVQLTQNQGIIELQFNGTAGQTVILEVKSATSLATLFRQPNTQTLAIPSPVSYALTAGSGDGTAPTLQLGFKQQGLTTSGVLTTGRLALKKGTDNPLNFDRVSLKSEAGGVLKLNSPINLPPETIGQKYAVYVKTNTTLMKKLGEMTIAAGLNNTPTTWQDNPLLVGDFDTSQGQANIFNIADVAKMLAIYTQLRLPVTPQTLSYDVNFDGTIDIADVALVLSNFTTLQKTGDAP